MTPTLRHGDSGATVHALQQGLVEAGSSSISDEELASQRFGVTTQEALLAYQTAHGLVADGVCGPKTWASLNGSDGAWTPPGWRCDPGTGEAKAVLAWAVAQLGTVEAPPGSNSGPKINAWLARAHLPPGEPWCAAFARAAWMQSARFRAMRPPGLGSGEKWRDWARNSGLLVADSEPIKPGDVGIISTGPHSSHVVLVCAVLDGDMLATVEGNHGNAVRGGMRRRDAFAAVVRLFG